MEKERMDYLEKHGHETYWTNSVFGGMPTYLLGSSFPYDFPGKIDKILKTFPKPVNYLFLYFVGFLILMLVLKIKPLPALAGAFGFTLSTYLIIILQVGHFAKASAIAYFPWVLAGVFLVWKRKKYLPGFLLTSIGMALEIHAKHYQMTYYLGLAISILGIIYLIEAVREKQIKRFFVESFILISSVVLAVGMNWTSMTAIKQYISQSIRGEQFLTIKPDGSPIEKKEGLDKNYITEYSYGIAETFNLFIPGFTGGSNREKLDENSALYQQVRKMTTKKQALQFVENVSLYWGKQPIVMAPAYIGAVIWLLALIGFFLVKGKIRKWIIITSVFTLMLSWGKNFPILTDMFIDYFPYYNKFRVVASIQVILELLIPFMAVLGLIAFFDQNLSREHKIKALKLSAGILGGIALFFMLLGGQLFDFTSPSDAYYEQYRLLDALLEDRKSLLFSDSLRSLILVLTTAGLLWLSLQKKLKEYQAISLVILLIVLDLGGVASRYIRNDDFKSPVEIKRIFTPSAVDNQIKQDTSYYRVINFSRNPLTDGLTSYFHKNLGGYHAAKPRRIQDIFDFHINQKIHFPVLNMYNVKYIIHPDQENNLTFSPNNEAFGAAWFVKSLKTLSGQNEEILAIEKVNRDTAFYSGYEELSNFVPHKDSLSKIDLVSYEPNRLKYEYSNRGDGFVVFSENFYPYGWKATIDNTPVEIYRVNYSLRGLKVPAGEHKIEFVFEPQVIKKGTYVQLFFILIFGMVLIIYMFGLWKKQKKK